MVARRSQKTTCPECGMLCEAGAAEYHPYEFCRAIKAGWSGPWVGIDAKLLDDIHPNHKLSIQRDLSEFWRGYYKTEITLP